MLPNLIEHAFKSPCFRQVFWHCGPSWGLSPPTEPPHGGIYLVTTDRDITLLPNGISQWI